MTKYDLKIHHRRSIRLTGYDYSSAGLYFITICTHGKKCIFGHIYNGEMIYNNFGEFIAENFIKIPEQFPNVMIYESVIMPNHIHFVIELNDEQGRADPAPTTPTIGNIIAWFKYHTTKQINLPDKLWQRNYYEHIIRNEKSYGEIREYITTNPLHWTKDSLFVE